MTDTTAEENGSGARVVWAPDGTDSARTRLGGAWWPRSRDAAGELRDLLPCAEAHLGGGVTRVSLNMDSWGSDQPRRLRALDRPIRLGWFHTLDRATVTLGRGSNGRTTLLVIPSDTDPASGRRLLAALATADPWPETVAEAMASSSPAPDQPDATS
jgi:hypothetical protein